MNESYQPWLNWAIELQALAQNGLAFTKDKYDRERFERIRQISAEMLAHKSGISTEKVEDLFCCETGYQTPKLDVRAAVFRGDEILMVREGGLWTLPGGYIDVWDSVASAAVREAKEESGFDVHAERLIAVQDRNRHNQPPHAFGALKIFVLCGLLGGAFAENMETDACGFFSLGALPELDTKRTNLAQIEMCFRANGDDNWRTEFD